MAITPREREVTAVGISVAAGCKPCTDYHVREAGKAGASDDEIRRAVADALEVRRSAADIMETHALDQLGGEAPGRAAPCACGETRRITVLTSIGAAFAVNCASNLETHLATAPGAGISRDEIEEILELSATIKAAAAKHAGRAAGQPQPAAGADCSST
jgi:AhpD family alkylhydroperoxidase